MKSTGSRPPGEQSRFSWHLTQCESFRRYSTFRLFSEKITNLRREVKEGAISKELSLGCCSTSNLSLSMDTRAERPTWCDFSNEQLPFSSHRTHTVWELLPEGDVRGQQWPSSFRGRRRGRDDEVWHNPARRKNQQETALLLHRGMTHQYCQVVVAVTKCSLLLVFAQYLPLLLFLTTTKKRIYFEQIWKNHMQLLMRPICLLIRTVLAATLYFQNLNRSPDLGSLRCSDPLLSSSGSDPLLRSSGSDLLLRSSLNISVDSLQNSQSALTSVGECKYCIHSLALTLQYCGVLTNISASWWIFFIGIWTHIFKIVLA